MNKEILTEQRISADCNKTMRLRLFNALFFVAVAAVPVLLVIITPSPFSPELQVWFLRALSALAWAVCIAAVAVAVYKTTVATVVIVRLLRKGFTVVTDNVKSADIYSKYRCGFFDGDKIHCTNCTCRIMRFRKYGRYYPCRGAGLPERAWILEEDPPFKIEAGDPYYLVLAKKRIVGVYNRKYYEFEGGEQ